MSSDQQGLTFNQWMRLLKRDFLTEKDHELFFQTLEKNGDWLNKKRNTSTALMLAADYQHQDIFNALVHQGAEMNHQNKEGSTAVMKALSHGWIESLSEWVEKGADLNHQDSFGCTALIHASYSGQLKVMQALMKVGVDIHVQDHEGYSALMWAVCSGKNEGIHLLIQAGADVMAVNDRGQTALMLALDQKEIGLAMVRELIEVGSDFHRQDRDGWSAWMVAVKNGSIPVVQLFLEKLDQEAEDFQSIFQQVLEFTQNLQQDEVLDFLKSFQSEKQLKELLETQRCNEHKPARL